MNILLKTFHKFKAEGFSETLHSISNFVFRKIDKICFKLFSIVNCKLLNFSKKIVVHVPVELPKANFLISNEVFLKTIQERKFKVLSQNFEVFTEGSEDICWFKDPVSNYKWPTDSWGVDIRIDYDKGEIKRPWDFGRLYFLVELSLRFVNEKDEILRQRLISTAEQILISFNKNNPCFYGPQWICAMDVGIRISNICLAMDIFGKDFVQKNESLLSFELSRHVFFIEHNLESKNRGIVNNHYLGNLAGLIFALVHIDSSKTNAKKIKKYTQFLLQEIQDQFLEDGGNFEGSTYYHRLSNELILFPLALAIDFNSELVTANQMNALEQKLQKINSFAKVITDFEGQVPQIGDNDSGHLFIFDSEKYVSTDLNFSNIISANNAFLNSTNKDRLFEKVVSAYINVTESISNKEIKNIQKSFDNFEPYLEKMRKCKNKQIYSFRYESLDVNSLKLFNFNEFGLLVFKNDDFFLSIRCGQPSSEKVGGHRHIDQLSFSLKTRTISSPRDPGTYLYTSNSTMRNLFRSAELHHIPFIEGDCSLNDLDLFHLNRFFGKCLGVTKSSFLGTYEGALDNYYRYIEIGERELTIIDWSESDAAIKKLDFSEKYFSPLYGVVQVKI